MRIVIYKSGIFKQKYSFKIIARNGEIIAVSEKYYNLNDCEDTVALIKFGVSRCRVEYDFDRDED